MKYCHNCGAPLVDDVRFCTACGSPLDPPETEPAMPESAVMPEMPEPAPEMPVMPGEPLPPEPPKSAKADLALDPAPGRCAGAGRRSAVLLPRVECARGPRAAAWQKTAAALETEVGRPENLMAFAETLQGPLSEQRALTASLTFESDGETLAAKIYSQRDNAARRLGGTAELTMPWGRDAAYFVLWRCGGAAAHAARHHGRGLQHPGARRCRGLCRFRPRRNAG